MVVHRTPTSPTLSPPVPHLPTSTLNTFPHQHTRSRGRLEDVVHAFDTKRRTFLVSARAYLLRYALGLVG